MWNPVKWCYSRVGALPLLVGGDYSEKIHLCGQICLSCLWFVMFEDGQNDKNVHQALVQIYIAFILRRRDDY